MPLRIKYKVAIFFLVLYVGTIGNAQTAEQNYDCLSIDNLGLLKQSFDSFEKDLFNHYKFNNDTIKTYRTFLTQVYSLSINLRQLPSANSIRLARIYKQKASDRNSLWVLLSQYDEEMTASKENVVSKTDQEEVLTFNYRGGFIQCLKNTSNSQGFKDIIDTLEYDGNVSPSVIAQKLHDLPTDEFNSYEVKSFIAFDIYYSILLVIEKAFK